MEIWLSAEAKMLVLRNTIKIVIRDSFTLIINLSNTYYICILFC